ncbi:unnamed protein product [Blepharisma stoltei]|uniref:Uncharacterized protein n=1 Tax=Blepharisma stoltei TaxID=1481888 RepID=A0AAU9JKC3_9CILI|nr:unnamed protein product [Blepharisma stoltei]
MIFALLLGLAASQSTTPTTIHDGQTVDGSKHSFLGGLDLYLFHVSNLTGSDLALTLTTYSDWDDPDLVVSKGSAPTLDNFDWISLTWGMGSIVIPSDELSAETDYYILVSCYTYCRYSLTVSYMSEITLIEGVPMSGILSKGRQQVYKFLTPDTASEQLSIDVTLRNGDIKLFVSKNGEEPGTSNTLPVDKAWHSGMTFSDPVPDVSTWYRAAVVALEDSQFTVIANLNQTEVVDLQASITSYGIVNFSEFNYYKIYVDNENETLSIFLTQFSGDADIYVKAGKAPTRKDYDFCSIQVGNDTLTISSSQRQGINKSVGYYYIGIYGISHSAYGLTASINQESVVWLVPGIPLTSFVDSHDISMHYLNLVPNSVYNISIHLTALSGNPDLYAKLCSSTDVKSCTFTEDELSGQSSSVYSSRNQYGSDSITISHQANSCRANLTCAYLIGVKGSSSSRSDYTVLATYNSTMEQFLQEGRPVSMSVTGGDYKYFKYNVFNITVMQVEFILTPITGDPDLFSSRTYQPSTSNYEMSSRKNGVMVDSIKYAKGVDGETLNGEYHVAVYSTLSSSFSIVAKETIPGTNTTILIYPGHPQKDTLFNSNDTDYRIYYFPIHFTQQTKKPIRVSLTPITGKFSLYVANQLENLDWSREIFWYNWMGYSNGSDPNNVINILPSDPQYKLDSTYLILVNGEEFAYDNTSTYSIVLSVGDGTVILSDDVPYTDQVSDKSYNFYMYPIHEDHQEVTISVTALTGDPDIYVSVFPNNTRPTKPNFDYASNVFGSDTITLDYNRDIKQGCQSTQTSCNLYIGIHGYVASTYTIRVHSKNNLPKALVSGAPETDQLNKTQYNFYYYSASTLVPLSISIQSSQGDADLYVNLMDSTVAGSNTSSWLMPTLYHAQYLSMSTSLIDEINLNNTALGSGCPSGTCIALVGVLCFSDFCRYTIEVNQNSVYTLMEGESKYGYVESGKFVYYSYYCDKDWTDLVFTVTPLSSGDPDLFVSKGRDQRPVHSSSNWNSQSWGGDLVSIMSNDTYFKTGNITMKGIYIIGVYGASASSFTLTANSHSQAITKLTVGQPTYGSVRLNSINYYYFVNSARQDITIQVTPNMGDPVLYANPDASDDDLYGKMPTSTNYTWSSISSSDRYTIKISKDDPNLCLLCNIVIGVLANNYNCSYSIIVSTTASSILLQNGVQYNSRLNTDEYHYYYFQVVNKSDIDVSFTLFSGNGRIFLNTNDTIDKNHYLWTSNDSSKIKHIHIKENDRNLRIGLYYIAVYGEEDASYSVIATTRNSYISLVDGWPQTYSLEYYSQDKLYFTYKIPNGFNSPVYCHLRSFQQEFKPWVYADIYLRSFDSTRDYPSPSIHDQAYNISNYIDYSNTLQMVFMPKPQATKINLAVFGMTRPNHSSDELGDFELVCSSSMQYTVLREGASVIDSSSSSIKTHRYEVNIDTKGKLEVIIIPCEGAVKMEISSNWTMLSQDGPDVVVTRPADGRIVGDINNAQGKYFVTVSQLNANTSTGNTTYQIIAKVVKPGQTKDKLVIPGHDGLIESTRIGRDVLSLFWEPPVYENNDAYEKSSEVVYEIFFTPNEEELMSTACGMYYSWIHNRSIWLGESGAGNTTFEAEFPESDGILNIIAVLPVHDQNWLHYIPYDPISVSRGSPPPHHWIWRFVIWGSASILVVAVALAFIFYKKYRRSQKRLEYEMTDVRNVAAAGLNIQPQPNNYDPLHEEKIDS